MAAHADRCLVCMGGGGDDDDRCRAPSLFRYCDQCTGVLHADCMRQLLRRSAPHLTWRRRVVVVAGADDHGDARDDTSTSAARLVFVPQHVISVMHICLLRAFVRMRLCAYRCARMFTHRATALQYEKDRVPFVAALVFDGRAAVVGGSHNERMRTFAIALVGDDQGDDEHDGAAHTVRRARVLTAPQSPAVRFEEAALVKCIQCRHERILDVCDGTDDDDDDDDDNDNDSDDGGGRIVDAHLPFHHIATHCVYTCAAACVAMYLHAAVYERIGLAAIVLPLPAFAYFVAWTIVGGPWHVLAPSVANRLIWFSARQRRDAFWDVEQLRRAAAVLRERAPATLLVHTLHIAAPRLERFLLHCLVPVDDAAFATTLQGLDCARTAWTGAYAWFDSATTRVAVDEHAAALHVRGGGREGGGADLRFEVASGARRRWAAWTSGAAAGMRYAGWFAGPSWRALVFLLLLYGGRVDSRDYASAAHALYVVMTMVETVRACAFAFAACYWLPRHMPRLFNTVRAPRHHVLRPVARVVTATMARQASRATTTAVTSGT